MRLHLIRHGQTAANVSKLLDTAHPGNDLTAEGRAQAEALVDRLGAEPIEAIYTSDLVRTHQTAAPLAAALGLSPVALPGLAEIKAGEYEMSDDFAPYISVLAAWATDLTAAMPGGDSGEGFVTRYDEAIATIVSDASARGFDTAVAFSHGAAMRAWTAMRAGVPLEWSRDRPVSNTTVFTLDHDGDRWRMVAWGDELLPDG